MQLVNCPASHPAWIGEKNDTAGSADGEIGRFNSKFGEVYGGGRRPPIDDDEDDAPPKK